VQEQEAPQAQMLHPATERTGSDPPHIKHAEAVRTSIACLCATKVVDAAGHPTPGPLRFCRVTIAVLMRCNWSSPELPVGNVTGMEGLLTTLPARTLALSEARKASRAGGHVHGILMGWPFGPGIPSQSPVPRLLDMSMPLLSVVETRQRTGGIEPCWVPEVGYEVFWDVSLVQGCARDAGGVESDN
jgi:hypothetical protein